MKKKPDEVKYRLELDDSLTAARIKMYSEKSEIEVTVGQVFALNTDNPGFILENGITRNALANILALVHSYQNNSA